MENEINDEVKSNNKNNEILDVLGEITSLINQYIADNQENLNLVQLKLSFLLKTIQELFYPKNINLTPNIEIKKINLLNSSDNSNVINAKTIYNIQKKLNENKFFSVNLNSSTVGNLYEQNNSNSEYIYEIINLKRKLKEEHEKYLLRELAYLDRISVIQNQLKKYENEKINQKFPNISDINSNNNSIISSNRTMSKNINKFLYSKRKNNSSCDNLFNYTTKRSNRNNIGFSYFGKNFNLNDFHEHKQHNSIKKLHYKYDVGNSYLKHDFNNIQKIIFKNNKVIRSLKDSYSPSFCIKESENNSKSNKS